LSFSIPHFTILLLLLPLFRKDRNSGESWQKFVGGIADDKEWRGRSSRSGLEGVSQNGSPGRFVAHTERISNMRKSSRLWWLHGAILLSAVIGCKNCGGSGGSCGAPSATGSPYGTAMGGPTVGGGPTMYSQGSYPSSTGGMTGMTGAPSGGQGFPTQPTASSFGR
jgi:hypothetical protein